MAQQIIQGNDILSKKIRTRRIEMGLTIEEAASRAGVGTKTWYRYETGESIRKDKWKGLCKALNWQYLSDQDENKDSNSFQKYRSNEAWSLFLESEFGVGAAIAFIVGSDRLLGYIEEDMEELSMMPADSHIGELDISWLKDSLPKQFLMHYDYEFLYNLKCTLIKMRRRAKAGLSMMAHSVIEELLYYLCNNVAAMIMEFNDEFDMDEDVMGSHYGDWIFELFGDMDIYACLFSDVYLETDHSYHFCHWTDQQFYIKSTEGQDIIEK